MTITVIEGSKRQTIPFDAGDTILAALQRGGISSVHAPCGGRGICKKCSVYVRNGTFSGICLACTTRAEDGMLVELSPTVRLSFAEDSAASVYPPTPGQTGYAVACDLGTTAIVCRLLRLDTGEQLAAVSGSNVQSVFGANVLARLQAASEGRADVMTEVVIMQVNKYIASMCAKAGVAVSDVKMIAVAGNTIMEYLFAGLNPADDGIAPFRPKTRFGELLDARSLGLCFDGKAYLCPVISGFIGGDVTAGMLSTGMADAEKPVLMADLGTNSEIILGCGGRFVACTADAGAAFKASLLDRGMTASAGAIAGVEYADGRLSLRVLGDTKPIGICGSGMIDALGIMYRLDALDEMGHIASPEDVAPEVAPLLGEVDGGRVFFLTENKKVFITQADISKFQLAKAAISAGIRILAEESGLRLTEISDVLLAGGFGAFARPSNAAAIGLIPGELLSRARLMGNTAAAGAASAAVSGEARARLSAIRDSVRCVELPTHPSFGDAYVEGMLFV